MFILQISDLHFSETSDKVLLEKKLTYLINSLKTLLPTQSNVVCCLLGDIIDAGKPNSYSLAESLLKSFFSKLTDVIGKENLAFEIVPGNHDLCTNSLTSFNSFSTNLLKQHIEFSDNNSIHKSEHFGYCFISMSSILNAERHFGQIDFTNLNSLEIPPNSIFLTHHALISGDAEDTAAIRNGYKLQKILEEKNTIALLHGHTHGFKRYTVGHDCQIIGVGPMFKHVPDISNQCNLIEITRNQITKVTTLTYHDDRETWDTNITYKKSISNNYTGTSIEAVYKQVLEDATSNMLLPNLCIQVKQDFNSFENDIQNYFHASLEEAEEWQKSDCSPKLSYTHGQLMNYKNASWDEHITNTLIQNPTSKRALIPLIDKEMSYKGGDNKLVSFDIVQFGFENTNCNDLHITIYFRALEIKNFLPINICEMYLMAKKIQKKIQSIHNVTLCLFAFKAEVKDNYGCYKKAQIDLLNQSEICKMIFKNNFEELKELLYEKAHMGETVIELDWFCNLETALTTVYEKPNVADVTKQLGIVKTTLLKLKEERTRCSNYPATQSLENTFQSTVYTLADMLMERIDE